MKARSTSRVSAPWNLNHLRLGATYQATTQHRTTAGEYLGMETPHGDRSILLRHRTGTESIALSDIMSLQPAIA
ncbi:MAG: hypothetical protein U9N78_03010 [Actinomycetota bacterium]|nr:hypothetical protein [Actinomycetota bacterium]